MITGLEWRTRLWAAATVTAAGAAVAFAICGDLSRSVIFVVAAAMMLGFLVRKTASPAYWERPLTCGDIAGIFGVMAAGIFVDEILYLFFAGAIGMGAADNWQRLPPARRWR